MTVVILVKTDLTIQRVSSDYVIKEGERILLDEKYYIESIGKLKPLYDENIDSVVEGATKKEIEEFQEALQKEFYPSGQPELSFEQVQQTKLKEIENAREEVYKQGVTVTTSLGEKTFSLTGQDQTNISGLQSKVLIGDPSVANGVPYHANGEFCIWWSHEDFTLIATKASEFVFYHTTYSNFLNRYIEQIDTIEELEKVYYGMELPKEIAEQFALFMKGGAV